MVKGFVINIPKSERDPSDGPKRPKTGFMFFSIERRIRLKEELPGLSIADASKVIGGEWRDLSDPEKHPFNALAERVLESGLETLSKSLRLVCMMEKQR